MLVLDAVPFSNESTMVQDFLQILDKPSYKKKVLAGIVFTKVPSVCHGMPVSNIEYKLRFPSMLRSASRKMSVSPFANANHWMTQYIVPVFQTVGPRKGSHKQGGPPG